VLGVGRGDSALRSLGRPPALVADLETFLADVAAYLAGAAPALDPVAWIGRVPRVPLDVAATGPKVIAAAARHADQITFAGADRAALEQLARDYTLAGHGDARSPQTEGLDPEFLARFAIFGTPGTCAERLGALAGRGAAPAHRDHFGKTGAFTGAAWLSRWPGSPRRCSPPSPVAA
jgi:alkanesulfonate monooxygenase SsuD/methylene tetrahydromethanopterin reductase-like flavin-dependent oxidoreductase (luciferase family)